MQVTKLYILSDGDGPVRYVGKTVQRITDEMLIQARSRIADGWSHQRAADELGISQSQLSLRLKGRCR